MAGTVILHLIDKRQGEIQQLARVTQLEKGEELGFEPRQTDSQGTSQEDPRESGPVPEEGRGASESAAGEEQPARVGTSLLAWP